MTVAYVPDVFGLNRRTVESLSAQQQEARFQMIATYNTLVANVVVTAIQESSVRLQVEATRQLLEANTGNLKIVQYQLSKGYASRLDVAAQESQLAQVAATLPPLLKQQAQLRDLLAALVGRFPNQAPAEELELTSLQLPQELPVSLPSALVAQRPDVRQAEENMHDASAKIGVAIANRLPNIQLTANAGSTRSPCARCSPRHRILGLGAEHDRAAVPGRHAAAQERAAKAAYVQASEQYRSTVLSAFQNVADTLVALEQDAEGLKAANAAADAAKITLDLTQEQWQRGYAG